MHTLAPPLLTLYFEERGMRESEWRALTRIANVYGHEDWNEVMDCIRKATPSRRKAIVTLCRAQTDPDKDTTLYDKVSTELSDGKITMISHYTKSSVMAGLLLSIVKHAPYDDTTISELFKKAALKELHVTQSECKPSSIDYRALLSKEPCSVIPDVPVNEFAQQKLCRVIAIWKNKLNSTRLYPGMSRKSMSSDTMRSGIEEGVILADHERISQIDVERHYMKTGVKIGGICEMKQVWTPDQIAPRTYFTSGGYAYHRTKYMKKVFGWLCDLLELCNKYLCVQPSRLNCDDSEFGFIYDLTAFTSNLHEWRYFLHALARDCDGLMVEVMDSRIGVCTCDMGRLLDEYASVCVDTEYSAEKVLQIYQPLVARVGGLLGLYGNIQASKFLHASVVLHSIHRLDKANTAGDDGIIATDYVERHLPYIESLGHLELTKCYNTYEQGCIHLKRPLLQIGCCFVSLSQVMWPCLEFNTNDDMLDPRYPQIRHKYRSERREATASSIMTFLSSLQYQDIDQYEKATVHRILEYIYDRDHFPKGGHVPQISGNAHPFVCSIEGDYIGRDPITYTMRQLYCGIALLPVRELLSYDRNLEIGETKFRCNTDQHLTYLEKLGFIVGVKEQRYVYGPDGYEKLVNEFVSTLPSVYEYTVIENIPAYLLS